MSQPLRGRWPGRAAGCVKRNQLSARQRIEGLPEADAEQAM